MYEMKLDFPNLNKGDLVEVDGLGVFENGASYQISEEEAEQYRSTRPTVTTSTSKKGQMTTTSELGPTLLEDYSKHDHITVTISKKGGGDK